MQADLHIVVDRGHRHRSTGASETSLWFSALPTPVPDPLQVPLPRFRLNEGPHVEMGIDVVNEGTGVNVSAPPVPGMKPAVSSHDLVVANDEVEDYVQLSVLAFPHFRATPYRIRRSIALGKLMEAVFARNAELDRRSAEFSLMDREPNVLIAPEDTVASLGIVEGENICAT